MVVNDGIRHQAVSFLMDTSAAIHLYNMYLQSKTVNIFLKVTTLKITFHP
jgi:hypothetical protein